MNPDRKLLNIVISAVIALAFVHFYLKGRERSIEKGFDLVTVLSAARDIPPRTAIAPAMVALKQVPRRYMEPDAIAAERAEDGLRSIEGKVSVTALPAGKQITRNLLKTPTLESTGIAPLLPSGKRGYVLRLGNLDVAKVIYQGDYLDILATLNITRGERTSKVTSTILQNVLVLGVGREIRRPFGGSAPRSERVEGLVLTIAVDPMEAQRLALAQVDSQGEMNVLVRPKKDTVPVRVEPTTEEKILQ